MMHILVVGATGATGRLLVKQLLDLGHSVKAIVRSPHKLPKDVQRNPNLSIVQASILDLTEEEMQAHTNGCDAIASCLGHNLSFKGIYGPPRRLVTDAARRLCKAAMANQPDHPIKYVLMNTAGNSNRDLKEPISIGQKIVIGLLRLLLPPHADNEQAADHLRLKIGQKHPTIEWVAVRPDSLIDLDEVSPYEVHPSPTRSALFDPGKTSRTNVAHFMATLIHDRTVWEKWKGQMPVIYNA